jgi:DNA-binding protein H-NS
VDEAHELLEQIAERKIESGEAQAEEQAKQEKLAALQPQMKSGGIRAKLEARRMQSKGGTDADEGEALDRIRSGQQSRSAR